MFWQLPILLLERNGGNSCLPFRADRSQWVALGGALNVIAQELQANSIPASNMPCIKDGWHDLVPYAQKNNHSIHRELPRLKSRDKVKGGKLAPNRLKAC